MKDKFTLGIEISEQVTETAVPHEIKRYDVVPKKKIKVKEPEKSIFYRYRPGINSFRTSDFDV